MPAFANTFFAASDRALRRAMPDRYLLADWFELALIATLFMLLLFLFMRRFGLCSRLRNTRRHMLADVYQLYLYRRSVRLVIRGEFSLICRNLQYILLLTPTLLAGSFLFAILYNPLTDRYASAPLPPNHDFVIRLHALSNEAWNPALAALPNTTDLFTTARVRAPSIKTIFARLRASRPGLFPLAHTNATVNIQSPHRPTRPWQYSQGLEIHIPYPPARWWGLTHGWLLYFLLICLITCFPLARLIKLEL